MRHHRHLNHPALLPLWKSLERDWLLQLLAITGLVLAAVTGVAIGLYGYPLVLVIAGGLTLTGIVLLIRHFRNPTPLQRLQDRLYDRPETVVWIYSIVNQHHPFGLEFQQRGILYFKCSDGEELSVDLPPHRLKLIGKVLARALPNAVFGYSREREESYIRDPRRLE